MTQQFKNPVGVAVNVIPVATNSGIKYLFVRRANAPFIGGLSFCGGFQDSGHTIREAAAAEAFQEIGLVIDPLSMRFLADMINDRDRCLYFFMTPVQAYDSLFDATGKYKLPIQESEVQEVVLGDVNTTLCFPFHDQVLKEFCH